MKMILTVMVDDFNIFVIVTDDDDFIYWYSLGGGWRWGCNAQHLIIEEDVGDIFRGCNKIFRI